MPSVTSIRNRLKEVNRVLNGGEYGSNGNHYHSNAGTYSHNMSSNVHGNTLNSGLPSNSNSSTYGNSSYGNGQDTGVLGSDRVNSIDPYVSHDSTNTAGHGLHSSNPYANTYNPAESSNSGMSDNSLYADDYRSSLGNNSGIISPSMSGNNTLGGAGSISGMLRPVTGGNNTMGGNDSTMSMSGTQGTSYNGPRTLLVNKFEKLFAISLAGAPPHAPPVYTLNPNAKGASDIVLYRGPPEANQVVATASSTKRGVPPILHGQQLGMKTSSLSGNSTVTSPFGNFKWKLAQFSGSGSSLELYDDAGAQIAKYRAGGSGKKLDVFVRCDDYLVEMILITAVTNMMQNNKTDGKIAGKVLEAVLGA